MEAKEAPWTKKSHFPDQVFLQNNVIMESSSSYADGLSDCI